jgi:hypothetical protein
MLSVSRKAFLLPVLIFTTLQINCSEYRITEGIIKLEANNDKSNNSTLWEISKILLPVIGGAAINYVIQKYNEDPDITAINKEEKKIALAIQQHPDYPAIQTQYKKNEIEEKKLTLKQKRFELDATKASIIQHHQEKWNEFKQCKSPYTPDYCSYMITLHQQELDKFIKKPQNNDHS